jgi:uncharacterized LabA/DUF88 family protein
MCFIDGENFTIRAQSLAQEHKISLIEGPYFKRDCFIWIPGFNGRKRLGSTWPNTHEAPIRSSYYTSMIGDDGAIEDVRDQLRALRFSGFVFKKTRRDVKAKGVDIALTKDMLSHAFLGNYETAVLVAGDGDYLPLIEEVQRLGKRVWIWFFADCGMNPELRRMADDFHDLTHLFTGQWKNHSNAALPNF